MLSISLLRWAGIALGFFAAYYWFRASKATVSIEDKQYAGTPDVVTDDFVPDDSKNKSRGIHLVGTWKEQSKLNKTAAKLTALAVACQAIASLIELMT